MISIWNNMWKHWFLFLTLFMNFFYLHFQKMRVIWECFAYPPQCVWMFFQLVLGSETVLSSSASGSISMVGTYLMCSCVWYTVWYTVHWYTVDSLMVRMLSRWNCRSPLTLPSALHVIRACRALEWVNDILARCENTSGSPKWVTL